MLTDILPPAQRRIAYVVFALLGVAVGAIQVGYGAAETSQPTWLTVALAVYAFLGGALGMTAASNTPTPQHRRDDTGAIDLRDVLVLVLIVFVVVAILALLGALGPIGR